MTSAIEKVKLLLDFVLGEDENDFVTKLRISNFRRRAEEEEEGRVRSQRDVDVMEDAAGQSAPFRRQMRATQANKFLARPTKFVSRPRSLSLVTSREISE